MPKFKGHPTHVKCKRVTFNRDARHADAKRLHIADLVFLASEWEVIERELHLFLQPNQKLEDIEPVYAEDKVKPTKAAPPPTAEPEE